MLPWDEEDAAAVLLASILGGIPICRDPGGGPASVHDYDLVLLSGRVIAIEVTIATDRAWRRSVGASEKLQWGGPDLAYDWHLGLDIKADLKAVGQYAAALLHAIEVLGEVRSMPLPNRGSHGPLATICQSLRDLGAWSVMPTDPTGADGHGVVHPHVTPPGGAASLDPVVDAITPHLLDEGNRKKLRDAECDSPHLVIWVDQSSPATIEMAPGVGPQPDRGPPRVSPVLPPEVDCVWVVSAFIPMRVFSFTLAKGWEDHGWWFPGGESPAELPTSVSAG